MSANLDFSGITRYGSRPHPPSAEASGFAAAWSQMRGTTVPPNPAPIARYFTERQVLHWMASRVALLLVRLAAMTMPGTHTSRLTSFELSDRSARGGFVRPEVHLDLHGLEHVLRAAHARHDVALLRIRAVLLPQRFHGRDRGLFEHRDVHLRPRAQLLRQVGVVRDDVFEHHRQFTWGLVLVQRVAVRELAVGEVELGGLESCAGNRETRASPGRG